jgi:hypothetical protein
VRPSLYTIARVGTGRLSTMAKPRGGDWLDDEMRALAGAGVTALVSLLTEEEARELDLVREAEAASVLAAAVLVEEGLDPDDAWRRIAEARGRPVPDTEEQRAFVASLRA